MHCYGKSVGSEDSCGTSRFREPTAELQLSRILYQESRSATWTWSRIPSHSAQSSGGSLQCQCGLYLGIIHALYTIYAAPLPRNLSRMPPDPCSYTWSVMEPSERPVPRMPVQKCPCTREKLGDSLRAGSGTDTCLSFSATLYFRIICILYSS